jgi:hypothetical protein
MRKLSTCLAFLLIAVLTATLTGCGTAETAGAGATSQELLTAAFNCSYEPTAATGGFSFEVGVDADEAQIPASVIEKARSIIDNGVTISGTYACAEDPMAVELLASGQIGGEPLDAGLKLHGTECWLGFAGDWYTVPPLDMAMATAYFTQIDPEEVGDLVNDLGLDPTTWFGDIQIVGDETLGGVATVHLAGTLDLVKIIDDSFGLMQSEELLALIDPTGELTTDMLSGSGFPPSASDMQEMRTMLESMIPGGPAIELWLDKDTAMVRKVAFVAHITPPPGEDSEGILGIDVSGQIWVDTLDQPVQVEAPASPLPISELQNAVESSNLFQFFD